MVELTNHTRANARRTYYALFGVVLALLVALLILVYAWTSSVSDAQNRADCRAKLQGKALAETILIFDIPGTDQAARSMQVDEAVRAAHRVERSERICT